MSDVELTGHRQQQPVLTATSPQPPPNRAFSAPVSGLLTHSPRRRPAAMRGKALDRRAIEYNSSFSDATASDIGCTSSDAIMESSEEQLFFGKEEEDSLGLEWANSPAAFGEEWEEGGEYGDDELKEG